MATFTKTFDGKKFHYCFNGKPYRNSGRDFKYGCFITSRESGKTWPVSLGNDKQSTLKSMAHCYAHYCDLEVVEVVGEHVVKVADYMKKDWGVEVIGYYDTLGKAMTAAEEYEKTLTGKSYKREFCKFDEDGVIRKGYIIRIF